jgi:hypothetical protein
MRLGARSLILDLARLALFPMRPHAGAHFRRTASEILVWGGRFDLPTAILPRFAPVDPETAEEWQEPGGQLGWWDVVGPFAIQENSVSVS